MTRIPLDPPASVLNRLVGWVARRRFGADLNPVGVAGHHAGVLVTTSLFELGVERWRTLDPQLKLLAVMATALRLGCSWCVDFGEWKGRMDGMDAEKIEAVPRWRDAEVFDDTERLVMDYAEAMTATPTEVTDAMVDRLRRELTDTQLVELTMTIAVENQRARVNNAMGIVSQGFSENCELPR
jgi:AhpD family alkylhydroperoxidase